MARKAREDPEPLAPEAWSAQEPCPSCGGRPGYDPTTGKRLLIKLPNGEWLDGHRYDCVTRPH